MISTFDYIVIGSYLILMIAVGVGFRKMSKDTSDYFRAGGAMPWWLTGASAWTVSFSAWTFTGAAGKVYETGTLVLVVFYATIVALIFAMRWTCVRFRRMGVITWMEAVRLRFGPFNEQFYIWIKLPLLLFFSGLGLNAVGVFMSAVFQVEMEVTLVALGLVVTLAAFSGGAWAVLASDFVQAFLIVTITLCTAVMVLAMPEIGGPGGLAEKVPRAHFHWGDLARPQLVALWCLGTLWLKFSDENSMERSTIYLMTRSDVDARKMVLIPLLGMLIGPLLWFIPSMAATVLHPDLAAEYPALKQPQEAAFISVAMDVMPQGLLGLLLSAMLGATITSMDSGLNKNVGIAIRSFYRPLLRPHASERHLLIAGKVCTLLFGAIIIFCALEIHRIRETNLFDFVNQLAAYLLTPLALPLVYGLFYKRTPGWSAWSTALVSAAAAWVIGRFCTPEWFQELAGWEQPLNADERTYLKLGLTTLGGTLLTGSAWFFFTGLFYERAPVEEKQRIEGFFRDLATPVGKQGAPDVRTTVYRLLGTLCLVYGIFIAALMLLLIPLQRLRLGPLLWVRGSLAGSGVQSHLAAGPQISADR